MSTDYTIPKGEYRALMAERDRLREERREYQATIDSLVDECADHKAENAKLREQIESIQPTDSEGNVLEVADTVHMLRSEYDGDHEWEDVVVELALTQSFGDGWIVRGSKGEAFACECTKTGHDDDAYENCSDAEPLDDATLIEVECHKLRLLLEGLAHCHKHNPHETCPLYRDTDDHSRFENWCRRNELAREFGVDAFDE